MNPEGFDISINEKDRVVHCTIWNNPGSTRVLIIAPAMGVTREFYKTIAIYFLNLSYSVISLDYYGMLKCQNLKSSLGDWGFKDINSVIEYTDKQFPGQELYFLGHSIAGQVFPLAKESYKIKAAYLVASQNVSKKNWSGLSKFKVNIFWYVVIPFCIGMFGYLPATAYGGKYGLHKSIALEWAKWGKSSLGILSRVSQAAKRYKNLNVPTRFLSFSDDDMLAPLKSVEHLYKSYGTAFKEHVHIHPEEYGMKFIGHFKFFKKECEFLWPEIDSWYDQISNCQDK